MLLVCFKPDFWITRQACSATTAAWHALLSQGIKYPMCAIITHGLYILKPVFEGQKCFYKGHFFLALCMASIQEQFEIKSGL
jgi:hypothetical protein